MGGRSKALASCRIVIAGQYKGYEPAKMSGWVSNLGGASQSKVNESTTHVVASEKAWQRKDAAVAAASKLNQDEGYDIKIVSFDWLEDSVVNKTRKREGPYLWEKLDASATKRSAAKKRANGTEGKKGHVGMMAEVFQEATDSFVDERERKKVEKQIQAEKRVREDMEAEERKERDEERKKTAELFGRGAKKARNELFTENHHLYTDDTGFKYDVLLTKVDTRNNRNERYALTLQIYESNSEPHTYAMNCQFAGTGLRPSNNVIAAIGTIFPTAFRAFKKTFKDKTGVEWDDRIGAALERSKRKKRDRGMGTGSEEGSRRGVPVSSVANGASKSKDEVDFDMMPFEYHPPRFGPRGKLPKEKVDELVEKHSLNSIGGNDRVESWMTGANGGESSGKAAKEKTPVQNPPPLNHFDALLNGDDMADHGNTNSPAFFPNAANNSVFDHDLNRFVDDVVEDHYPFTSNDTDLGGIDLSNEDFSNVDLDLDFNAFGDSSFGTVKNASGADLETSFDLTNGTTLTQHDPTSFDFPTSTVQDSFQPDTQEVGETQVAEQLAGELMESIDRQQNDSSGTGIVAAETSAPLPTSLTTGLNLGSSLLGKRKTLPTTAAGGSEEAQKKLKLADKANNLDTTATQANEADERGNSVAANSYLLHASDAGDVGGGGQIPRAMLEQSNAAATTAEEDNEIGWGNEMMDGIGVEIH